MTTHYDRETLTDYLHGALPPAEDAALFAHLQSCADCNAVYEEEARLGDILRAAARAEEFELPSLVKARVWDAVRREKPGVLDRMRAAWAPRVALPVAAALAIAAYLGVPALHAGPPPASGIEATLLLDEHNAQAQQNPFGPGAIPAVYGTDGVQDHAASVGSYIDTADAATLDSADGALR